VKAKKVWMTALCVAGLVAGSAILGCQREPSKPSGVAEKDKAATDKAAADKAALDKAAADKAALDKAEGEVASLQKAVADMEESDKAEAEKAAADLARAEKAAMQADAEAGALPPDLVEMKAEIGRMTAQIDLTTAKLEQLAAATGNFKQPSKDALAAIDALAAETKVLESRGDQMRDRGAAYFEVWEKQLASMSTPEVAEIATKRKTELSARYAEVLTAMQESRAAMDAYQGDMDVIRKAIDDGLTPETHTLLAQQVKAAKEKAKTLKSRIEATFAKVGQVSHIYTTN